MVTRGQGGAVVVVVVGGGGGVRVDGGRGGGCRMLDVQATDSTRLMTLRPPLK